MTNPLRHAERQALVWRTLYLLTVPPLFVAVCVLTSYLHEHQQSERQTVTRELSILSAR